MPFDESAQATYQRLKLWTVHGWRSPEKARHLSTVAGRACGYSFPKVAAIPEQTRFFAIADQPQGRLVGQGGGLARLPRLPVGRLLGCQLRSSP
jgi:hypothetical protein